MKYTKGKLPRSNKIMSMELMRQSVFSLFLICSVLSIPSTVVHAQTEVTKFLPINGVIIPFQVLIAPFGQLDVNIQQVVPYSAIISWNETADTTSYKVERFDASSNLWQVLYHGANRSYHAQNLEAAAHLFRVTACGSGLCGTPSNQVSVVIDVQYDTDLDGVLDYQDNCTATLIGREVDDRGCSSQQRDTDEDGINDAFDLCPDTPAETAVSEAGCVPTTVDSDGDGITNDLDWCANTASAASVNNQGCSEEQIDSDDDGTPDYLDEYPHQSANMCYG